VASRVGIARSAKRLRSAYGTYLAARARPARTRSYDQSGDATPADRCTSVRRARLARSSPPCSDGEVIYAEEQSEPGRGHRMRSVNVTQIPPADRVEALQDFVQACLQSPVELVPDTAQDSIDRSWLEFVAQAYEVDGEASECFGRDDDLTLCLPVREAHELDFLEAEDWRSMAINCAMWYRSAARAFTDHLGPCVLAPFVTEAERIKHFPIASDRSGADLERRSRSGQSIFLFGITSTALAEFTRSVESDVLDRLIGQAHFRVFVECMCVVGYSRGRQTSIIAVEWSSSGVHCYPVDDSDVARAGATNDLVMDDLLQGEGSETRE
jgi:hypothetical protein